MKKIVYSILALMLITTSGCKKFVEGYDKSPNDPSEVTPALLLSNCEVAYFATANGQLSRQTSMWVQQTTGVDGQSRDAQEYVIDEGTNINEWTVIYANGLNNLKQLYSQAGSDNPHYQGISRILTAMYLGLATDLWGDIPNREAMGGLGGPSNFNPHYDAQQAVIADIQAYLTEGIALLKKEGDKLNILAPGSDDMIYEGDVNMWIAAAHVLKARYHNRLSKKDAAGSANDALASLNEAKAAGFTSSDNNMYAKFGDNSNSYNQWYAFTVVERYGYMKTGLTMTDIMNKWSDPRLPFYCVADTGGGFNGSAPDAQNLDASEVGPYLATANAGFPLVTYYEAKFIEAEAKFRANDKPGAASAHNEAVLASVMEVTGSAPSQMFVDSQASETGASISLEKIMTHKYVAMYGQIESYSDWRRTSIPSLTPNANGAITTIPRRLPTPIDERLYNKNATVINDLTKPVWWDK